MQEYISEECLCKKINSLAKNLISSMVKFMKTHTTSSIERTALRLVGVNGVDSEGKPLPNALVDLLIENDMIYNGVLYWLSRGMAVMGKDPQIVAEALVQGNITKEQLEKVPRGKSLQIGRELAEASVRYLKDVQVQREPFRKGLADHTGQLYISSLGSGNIYEDIRLAVSVSDSQVNVIELHRASGQEILDYVPYGPTTEGLGGTYITQENCRLLRRAVDTVDNEGKYLFVGIDTNGLCMPEIAVIAGLEGIDFIKSCWFKGIYNRDINMKRALLDAYFTKLIAAKTGTTVVTNFSNLNPEADICIKSLDIELAKLANVQDWQILLDSSLQPLFSVDDINILIQRVQVLKQLYPVYTTSGKYYEVTESDFNDKLHTVLNNIIGTAVNSKFNDIGFINNITEENDLKFGYKSSQVGLIFNGILSNLQPESNKDTLVQTLALLEEIESMGLWKVIETQRFFKGNRCKFGGLGAEGLFVRGEDYFNPFWYLLRRKANETIAEDCTMCWSGNGNLKIDSKTEMAENQTIKVVGLNVGNRIGVGILDLVLTRDGKLGDKGLESYSCFDVKHLGTIDCPDEIEHYLEDIDADAIIICHNLESTREKLQPYKNLIDNGSIIVLGGPNINKKKVLSLGFEKTFDNNIYPSEIAKYLINTSKAKQGDKEGMSNTSE